MIKKREIPVSLVLSASEALYKWLGRNAASLAPPRTSVVNWNDRQRLLFPSLPAGFKPQPAQPAAFFS